MIREHRGENRLGTHHPEFLRRAEEEDWWLDFYMTCLYNARRQNAASKVAFNRMEKSGRYHALL